jgi:succinate dehydrogenase flavin-adding protein (antitoxin of CptAB toxin-antitoxin module)
MRKEDFEKLRWRCIRRGLLELDIVLTKFLDEDFAKLNDQQIQTFVALADLEDHDFWGLIAGTIEVTDPQQAEIIAMLRKNDVRASL